MNVRTIGATLVVGIASLSLAASAQASNASNPVVNTTFDGFTVGSAPLTDGWKSSGPFDHKVKAVDGNNMLRVSNAVTAGSFGDMTFSKPVVKPASENAATNVLVNEFTIKTDSADEQPGLSMSVSPDDGQGARMSYLRFDDKADGVHVIFGDYTHPAFNYRDVATLTHGTKYTIKFETTFVHGHDNDVVKVSIDGAEKVRGGSWEGYYRFNDENNPLASDRLIFRTAGTAAAATLGKGFLIDNVMSASSHVDNPAPLHPVVIPEGPQGPQGANGTNGINGKDGVTTIIRETKIVGATMRTVTAPTLNGGKLVSVKATLRGKKLPTSGRKVKVNLTGKTVGNYNVAITAKFRKGGKTHTVRSIRSLSVTLSA